MEKGGFITIIRYVFLLWSADWVSVGLRAGKVLIFLVYIVERWP